MYEWNPVVITYVVIQCRVLPLSSNSSQFCGITAGRSCLLLCYDQASTEHSILSFAQFEWAPTALQYRTLTKVLCTRTDSSLLEKLQLRRGAKDLPIGPYQRHRDQGFALWPPLASTTP